MAPNHRTLAAAEIAATGYLALPATGYRPQTTRSIILTSLFGPLLAGPAPEVATRTGRPPSNDWRALPLLMVQLVNPVSQDQASAVSKLVEMPFGLTMSIEPKTLRNRSDFRSLLPAHVGWGTIQAIFNVSTQAEAQSRLDAITWRAVGKQDHPDRTTHIALLAAVALSLQASPDLCYPGYNPLELALKVLDKLDNVRHVKGPRKNKRTREEVSYDTDDNGSDEDDTIQNVRNSRRRTGNHHRRTEAPGAPARLTHGPRLSAQLDELPSFNLDAVVNFSPPMMIDQPTAAPGAVLACSPVPRLGAATEPVMEEFLDGKDLPSDDELDGRCWEEELAASLVSPLLQAPPTPAGGASLAPAGSFAELLPAVSEPEVVLPPKENAPGMWSHSFHEMMAMLRPSFMGSEAAAAAAIAEVDT